MSIEKMLEGRTLLTSDEANGAHFSTGGRGGDGDDSNTGNGGNGGNGGNANGALFNTGGRGGDGGDSNTGPGGNGGPGGSTGSGNGSGNGNGSGSTSCVGGFEETQLLQLVNNMSSFSPTDPGSFTTLNEMSTSEHFITATSQTYA